jgi:hypothetical protein
MRIEKVGNRIPRRKQYSCGGSFRRCAAYAQTGAAEFVKSPGRPRGMPVRTQTEQRFPFDFAQVRVRSKEEVSARGPATR